MRKPKILIIGPTPPPYTGMSVATDTILNSSLREKFQVIHLNTADRRAISNMGKLDVINIALAVKHFFKFLRIIVRETPEVVYLPISQNSLGYLRDALFLIPCRIAGIKTIVHLHGGYFRNFYDSSNKVMKQIIRWTLRKVCAAIVLGECLKYIFEGLIPQEKIFVVPNGIEDAFAGDIKKKPINNSIRVLFLSNFLKEKGMFIVLSAIPGIVSKYKNARFVFAGEWYSKKDEKEATAFIEQHNIKGNVDFIGVVRGEKKKELLNTADVFVLPTFYPFEGQPLVILEAMAAGLPIVTTRKGAIPETIVDGKNGFLVEVEFPGQLEERIAELISNPDLCRKIGEDNRAEYLKRYTDKIFVDNLEIVLMKGISESVRVKDRILFVAPVPPPYAGPEVSTATLLNSRINEEFDVVYIRSNLHAHNRDRGKLKIASIARLFCLVLKMALAIIWRRPKVIYSFLCQNITGFVRDSIIVMVSKLFNRKIILHFHGSNFVNFYNSRSVIFQKYINFILSRVDFFVLQAHWLKKFFSQFVPDERMGIIYNSIHAVQFYNKEFKGKTNDKFRVFYMSYISTAKGFAVFVDACSELIKANVPIEAVVAGEIIARERNIFYSQDGHKIYFKDVDKIIEKVKGDRILNGNFVFLGEIKNIDRKKQAFYESDVFVLPSYSEGCPMVVLEAMAAGLPVIVTPVGALPEIIKDKENGLFMKLGDHRDLKNKIKFLMDNPLLCKKMGEKNRLLIESKFDVGKIIPQFCNLFEEVIGRN